MINIPQTFEEALEALDDIYINAKDKDIIDTYDLDQFLGASHSGLGMWIRNNWGLWKKESGLYKFFVSKGLFHADDMSGVLLKAWFCKHKKLDYSMDDDIKEYIKYWEGMKIEFKEI